MFSSKRKTGRSNKQISISFPFQNPDQKHSGPIITSPRSKIPQSNVVVLRAKYDFAAKSLSELSIKKGDYLKLLKRYGNGWLTVQCIETSSCGLVPASYMEIAVNDAQNPITIQWLQDAGSPKEASIDHVVSVTVTHAMLNTKDKVWYKLDVVLMSGKRVICAKYHRDFQNLLSVLQKEILLPNLSKLTEYPPTVSRSPGADLEIPKKVSQEYLAIISNLNLLFDGLLKHSEPFTKSILSQFIMDHRTKKILFKSSINSSSEKSILNSLDPDSLTLMGTVQKNHSYSTTAPLEPITTSNDSGSVRSSPVVSSTPTYSHTNVLYSSYLNQSGDHSFAQSREEFSGLADHVQTGTKSAMVHSESMRTLDSINSLIKMFELSSSDDDDEEEFERDSSPCKKHSFSSPKKSNSSTSSLMRNDLRRTSNETRSSNGLSDFSNPPKSLGTKSAEPVTPTLGQSNMFGGFLVKEYEYDEISPLKPKMHQDYMLSSKNKTGEKELEWTIPELRKHLA